MLAESYLESFTRNFDDQGNQESRMYVLEVISGFQAIFVDTALVITDLLPADILAEKILEIYTMGR